MSDDVEVCGCGHPDCPECNPRRAVASVTARPLPHTIVILQQRLSDGGHVYVERAMTWRELHDASARDFVLRAMIDQVFEEVRTRCGLR